MPKLYARKFLRAFLFCYKENILFISIKSIVNLLFIWYNVTKLKDIDEVQEFTSNKVQASERRCESRLCVKRYSLPSSNGETAVAVCG